MVAKPIVQDLTGGTFNDWSVIRYWGTEGNRRKWLCACVCGTERPVNESNLVQGRSKNCGCLRRKPTTHGMSKTPEYKSWSAMQERCRNPKSSYYANYGGRGVEVCARWRESFENFFADMGRMPGSGYSLERIDNNGDYEPGNCRWATRKEQMRNKRTNHLLTLQGKTMTLAEWAEVVGIESSAIRQRLNRGWSVEEALTTPLS